MFLPHCPLLVTVFLVFVLATAAAAAAAVATTAAFVWIVLLVSTLDDLRKEDRRTANRSHLDYLFPPLTLKLPLFPSFKVPAPRSFHVVFLTVTETPPATESSGPTYCTILLGSSAISGRLRQAHCAGVPLPTNLHQLFVAAASALSAFWLLASPCCFLRLIVAANQAVVVRLVGARFMAIHFCNQSSFWMFCHTCPRHTPFLCCVMLCLSVLLNAFVCYIPYRVLAEGSQLRCCVTCFCSHKLLTRVALSRGSRGITGTI